MIWQPKQLEAAKLLSDPTKKRILLRGGRRSGKTFTIAHFLRLRALNYPGCKQLIARKTLKNAAQSVWLETMLPILKADQAVKLCKIYRQPNLAEYKNGSLILLGGLAPNEIDDALGKEYSTIYPNECSEISYNVIPPLVSSLNERAIHKDTGAAIVPKLLLDCNPPTVKHWSYSMFMLGIDPVTKEPLKQREIYGTLQMNPGDNLPNLAEGYYESLEAMSHEIDSGIYSGNMGSSPGSCSITSTQKGTSMIRSRSAKIGGYFGRLTLGSQILLSACGHTMTRQMKRCTLKMSTIKQG